MKKMCCPITGVYLPRFIPSVLLGLLFLLGYNFVVHEKFLADLYAQTPDLWRTTEEMKDFCVFIIGGSAFLSFITALLYARHHEGKGLCEGLRFGSMLGLVFGILMALSYGWMPISWELAQSWFVSGFFEGLGLGVIFSLVYGCSKKSCCDEKATCCDTKKECCDTKEECCDTQKTCCDKGE